MTSCVGVDSSPRLGGEGSSTVFASTYTLRPSTAARRRLSGSRVRRPLAGGVVLYGVVRARVGFPTQSGPPRFAH